MEKHNIISWKIHILNGYFLWCKLLQCIIGTMIRWSMCANEFLREKNKCTNAISKHRPESKMHHDTAIIHPAIDEQNGSRWFIAIMLFFICTNNQCIAIYSGSLTHSFQRVNNSSWKLLVFDLKIKKKNPQQQQKELRVTHFGIFMRLYKL